MTPSPSFSGSGTIHSNALEWDSPVLVGGVASGSTVASHQYRGALDTSSTSTCASKTTRLIGDTQTAALVGLDGSIDWLCMPRFDSPACFAALVGDRSHGRWQIAPASTILSTSRRYRDRSLVLETEFTTETRNRAARGLHAAARQNDPDLVRIVEGVRGEVRMQMELVIRFDYGSIVPWVRRSTACFAPSAVPTPCRSATPVETRGVDLTTRAEFTVEPGERVPFVVVWHPSHLTAPTDRPVRRGRRNHRVVEGLGRELHIRRASGATKCCDRSSCSRR